MRSIKLQILALSVLLAVPAFGGGGATWWVSTEGNDILGTGQEGAPFRTINFAFSFASTGDTIRALQGTYNECVDISSSAVMAPRSVSLVADDWIDNSDNTTTIIDGTGLTCFDTFGTQVGVVHITGRSGQSGSIEGFTISGGAGSGIFAEGEVTITNNVVTGNGSTLGGGIYAYNATCRYGDTTLTISDNEISGNTAAYDAGLGFGGEGGGIYIFSSGSEAASGCLQGNPTVVVANNTISENTTTSADDDMFGAGMVLFSTSGPTRTVDVSITQNTISGNTMTPGSVGYGGGMWVTTFGFGTETINISENSFSSNSSTGDGGGMSAWLQSESTAVHQIIIDDNQLSSNTAGGDGGGMDLFMIADDLLSPGQSVSMRATNNQVLNNQSGGSFVGGGGILSTFFSERTEAAELNNMEFLIEGNTVTGNISSLSGGGLSVWARGDGDPDVGGIVENATATISVRNNLIAENQATDSGTGGGVFTYLQSYGPGVATTDLELNTIADNQAVAGAGGLEIEQLADFDAGGGTLGSNVVKVNSTLITGNDGFGIGGPGDGVAGVITPGNTFFELALDVDYSAIGLNGAADVETSMPQDQLDFVAGDPQIDANYIGLTCSPTIDGGDPLLTFSMEPAPNGGRINIGHTGNTLDAGTSLGDVNGDNAVDGVDLLRLSTAFSSVVGQGRYSAAADLTTNGAVDGDDLAVLASDFGTTCP